MAHILLVEDEDDLRFSLVHNLGFEGFEVQDVADGLLGWQAFEKNGAGFDLVILDIMIPGIDGLSLLKKIREVDDHIPIMMLTAKGTEMDKVIGFNLGADDYLAKPFGLGEFLARIKALLRRRLKAAPTKTEVDKARFYDVVVDFANHNVFVNSRKVHFSQKELQLMRYLINAAGQVVEKSKILEAVWGYKSNATSRTIDTHIARIRRKLQDRADHRIIQTVPTVGYKFVAPLQDSAAID